MLFLFSANTLQAQSVPLETNVVAGFGIDADVEADVLSFWLGIGNPELGTDDWFDYDGVNSGRAFIGDPTAQQLIDLNAGANVSVRIDMAEDPFFVDGNGRTWIDGLYARDQRTNGNFKDATVFGGGSDKNIHNPLVWEIKNGDVPQKNDIIDVYLGLRRDSPFPGPPDEYAYTGASTRSQDGTSYLDFEYFRKKLILGGSGVVYENAGDGLEGGHTAFIFGGDGLPTQLGDIIMSVNYTNGGVVADIRIFVWMDLSGGEASLVTLNGLGNLPFIFGDNNGGISFYDGGEQAGVYGYAQIQPKPDPENPDIPRIWAQVNAGAPVAGTPWPTINKGGDVSNTGMYPEFGLAEIAINATAFGLDSNTRPGLQCESPFGSVLVKTRSSDSFVAELKDLVGPFDFGDDVEVEVQVAESCIDGQTILTASLVNPGALVITYSWFIDGVWTSISGTDGTFVVTEAGNHTYTVYATAGAIDPVSGLPTESCFDTADIDAEPGSDLSITCPSDPNIAACQTQQAIDDAFDEFIGGLVINDATGNTTTVINIGGTLNSEDCSVEGGTTYDENYNVPEFECNGGSLTVHFIVTDECGQIECCTATFSVAADDTAPVLTAPGPESYQCIDEVPAAGMLGWTDNCDGSGEVQGSDQSDGQTCPETITRTWSYTDDCDNTTTVTQTITVDDDTAPEIINLPEIGTLCNDLFPTELFADWTDNCAVGGTGISSGEPVITDFECYQEAIYTFYIEDDCLNSDTETVMITREYDEVDNCETVFAYRQESDCFLDYGFSRWGWTTQITEPTGESGLIFNLYAGNGNDCDPTDGPGTFAGTATLTYADGMATVVYNMNDGFVLSGAHVYIGCDKFPISRKGGNTVAPGQYNFNPSLGGTVDTYTVGPVDVTGDFYIIIHGVSCEIACECSGGYTYTGDDDGNAFNGDSVDGCEPENVVTTKSVDFTAYPVPFDNEVTLKYVFDYDTDVKIEVFDTKGVLINGSADKDYVRNTEGKTKLDLSRTNDQLLFVRLTTNRGYVIKKIISSSPRAVRD